MHLVGFIIRVYHDARSPERHIRSLGDLIVDGMIIFNWLLKEYNGRTLAGFNWWEEIVNFQVP